MSLPSAKGNAFYLAKSGSIQAYSDGSSVVNFISTTTIAINKTPSRSTDAVNKAYVDLQVSTLTTLDNNNIASLQTLLSNYNSSELATLNSTASSLQSVISTEASTARASEVSLSSAISTEASTARASEVSLSSAILSEVNRANASESNLSSAISTEASTARASEVSLSSAISSEVSRAEASEVSLSTAISTEASTARASETSLSTAISSEASTARASEATLSTSISTEVSRAEASEASLSTAISTEVSTARASEVSLSSAISVEASTARASEVSLSSAISVEASTARASEALLSTSILNTNYKMVKSTVLPLNIFTFGGSSPTSAPPQYIDPSYNDLYDSNYLVYPMVDGWSFVNDGVNNKKIQWGTSFTDISGGYTLNVINGVNQIYFNVYINKTMNSGDLPYLVLYSNYPSYTSRINFTYANNLNPGYYTFVANLSGNNNVPPATFNSKIINMNFAYNGSLASTYSGLNAYTGSNQVFNYFTIQTNSASAAKACNITVTDLFIETNGTNTNIPAGTYNFKFTNAVVANQYLYTALNNLYLQLYNTTINNTVFPGDSNTSGYQKYLK